MAIGGHEEAEGAGVKRGERATAESDAEERGVAGMLAVSVGGAV